MTRRHPSRCSLAAVARHGAIIEITCHITALQCDALPTWGLLLLQTSSSRSTTLLLLIVDPRCLHFLRFSSISFRIPQSMGRTLHRRALQSPPKSRKKKSASTPSSGSSVTGSEASASTSASAPTNTTATEVAVFPSSQMANLNSTAFATQTLRRSARLRANRPVPAS